MKIKKFNQFEKNLTYISKKIDIRVDIEASRHAMDRFFRHGLEDKITESEVIDLAENSIEELTIALMSDKLNISETFVLKDKNSDLNIVAQLYPGKDNFRMVIITVMKKKDFTVDRNQYVIEI